LTAADLKNRALRVPVWIRGKPVVAEVKSLGSMNHPVFLVSGFGGERGAVIRRLKQIFKWESPLPAVAEHFALTDLRPLFVMFRGTPLAGEFGVYRALIKSIVHQQLNIEFANELTKRFVDMYGFEQDGAKFYPQPDKVATLTVDDLLRLQFSRRKAEYVIGASKMIASGELSMDDLSKASNEDAVKILMQIRGVGRWTAESVLLFGIGREDILPAGDVGIQNAFKHFFSREDKPKEEELREIGEREWSPYQSYASLSLWESLGSHSVPL
ncbi:MAG TPA: DNA-3-methyladenine glycosylase, partial [Bacillales bacterium]|nr:DNA-3-methyladenine glycosylase [Bacillales bacterium]